MYYTVSEDMLTWHQLDVELRCIFTFVSVMKGHSFKLDRSTSLYSLLVLPEFPFSSTCYLS